MAAPVALVAMAIAAAWRASMGLVPYLTEDLDGKIDGWCWSMKFEKETSSFRHDGFHMPLLGLPCESHRRKVEDLGCEPSTLRTGEGENWTQPVLGEGNAVGIGPSHRNSFSFGALASWERTLVAAEEFWMWLGATSGEPMRWIGATLEKRKPMRWIGATLRTKRFSAWIGTMLTSARRWIGATWCVRWIGATLSFDKGFDEKILSFDEGLGEKIFLLAAVVLCGITFNLVYLAVILVKNALVGERKVKMKKIGSQNTLNHLSQHRRKWNGSLRSRWESKMKLRSLAWIFLYVNSMNVAHGMDAAQASELLSRVMDLSAAATTAAQVTSNVLKKMEEREENHGKPRFGDGAKILKAPETFEVDDPVRYTLWKEQFTNWIVFCEAKYAALLEEAEKSDHTMDMVDFTDESKDLSLKLYSILSSYLKGPALQLVRAHSSDRNGFGVWQKLKEVYAPRTRPRTLAIGQAIMQHPAFSRDKSMLENLLNFDALLEQYELASGQRMPDDLIVSTVLRCIDGSTRRHLELTMDELMNYGNVKEKLVLMDKNTRSWSGETYLKHFQMVQAGQSSSSQGPVPMEVDQVQFGKGKKGKSKGKKGKWSGFGFPGGKFGGHKGKGKQKGRKGKGKNKGKNKSGKGRGPKPTDQCRLCHGYGHWGNECPQLHSANAVNASASEVSTTVAASDSVSNVDRKRLSAASTATSSTATTKTAGVRQVKMYHVATPPQQYPEEFSVGSEVPSENEEWWSCRMVSAHFDISDGDDSPREDGGDALHRWYAGLEPASCSESSAGSEPAIYQVGSGPTMGERIERLHVRAVGERSTLVVLDSGADISLLPIAMGSKGKSQRLERTVLEDAQGIRVETYGKRRAHVEVQTEQEDPVILEDEFIVASVQAPLISMGRLLHRGWRICPSTSPTGVSLLAPDGQCQIPVYYKKNSLALKAYIRQVSVSDESLESIEEEPHLEVLEKEESLAVATVVKVHSHLLQRLGRRGWVTSEAGNPFCLQPECNTYVDPSMVYWWQYWPMRSTLVRKGDGTWELVEHCERYYQKENVTAEIEECGGEKTLVLTMMHSSGEPADVFGQVLDHEMVQAGGVDGESLMFREEPNVPAELDPQHGVQEEEEDQQDRQLAVFDGELQWQFEEKEVLHVNDNMITAVSPVRLPRAAADFLGVSKAGSKQQLWSRLNQEVQRQEHLRAFEFANKLFLEEQRHKGLVEVKAPRQPTEVERSLHELTHIPFRSWCDFCLSCKSKSDAQRQVADEPEGRREVPAIQLDYAYGKSENHEKLLCVLVAVDCWTKMLLAMPLNSKGSNMKLQAEQLVRFSLNLNYYDMVEFVADSEPTTKSLLESVRLIRQQMGMSTTVTHSKPGDHGRTAQVERAVQTLRRQASTLVEMAEKRCLIKLPSDHAVVEWSYLHAAWILNRFATHSTTKVTPFELVNGRRYAGKLVCFGEVVMVLHRRVGCKQGPQWRPGVWVGKTSGSNEDLHVVIT